MKIKEYDTYVEIEGEKIELTDFHREAQNILSNTYGNVRGKLLWLQLLIFQRFNGWPIDYSFSKSYHIECALMRAGIQLENFMKK